MLSRLESSLSLVRRLNRAIARGHLDVAAELRAELDARDIAGGYSRARWAEKRDGKAAYGREWMREHRADQRASA